MAVAPGYRCWSCLAGVLGSAVAAAASAPDPRYTGTLAIREWTLEETGGRLQSFSVIQSPSTGLIYAGNEAGVLEYDGARWRLLPLPAGTPEGVGVARGLELDEADRLWAAGDNEVWIYSPDERGRWRPLSLRSRLPADRPALGVVWQLKMQGGFMWGVTTEGVIRIDRRSLALAAIPQTGNPAIIGTVDGWVWFQHSGNSLLRGRDKVLEPAPVPALPAGTWIHGIVRAADGTLQAEHTGGVLELRDGGWRPLGTELAARLAGRDSASRACRLPDGGRIFNTRSRTLVFADAAGRVLGVVAEPAGVNFGVTPRTFLDRDGGFWMANASGVRRAQIDPAVTRHGPAQGLRGGARRMAFDGEQMLVASAQGLFVRDAATGRFAQAEGSPADGHALLRSPAGGWLMAAGQRFAEWRDGAVVRTPGAPESGLSLASDPRDPARVLIGGMNGVQVFRRTAAGWEKEAVLDGLAAGLYHAACDAAGSLWLASGFQAGVWRAAAPGGDWTRGTVERLDGNEGAPAAPWKVAAVGGGVVVHGLQGLWREERPGGPLAPDVRFAGLPRGAATPVLSLAEGREGAIYVAGAQELQGRIWRGVRGGENGPWQFTELPLPEGRGHLRFEELHESPDGRTVWLGGGEAVFALDLAAAAPEFRAPMARWRGVRSPGTGEIFFGGAGEGRTVRLPQATRALALEFAAPALRVHLGGRTGIEYRSRISGVDDGWTAWSAAAARGLTNLHPGTVRMEVQARNHLGVEGPVAALALEVPPFWWETWWARTLAVLAGAGLVALAVRAIVRRQFRRRIALLVAQAAVQNERLRIARDMHDDLGSTLAGIVQLSDGTAADDSAPDARLARIHEAARELAQRTGDIVWAATPEHDSLESLVEQMARHAERTLGERGIKVDLQLPALVPDEGISAAARHDLFLAFKEAVNNAAKYSLARVATVRVELPPGALVVTLTDDGAGFAEGEVRGTGHGLANLRDRLGALGGRAEITSQKGGGTMVTLRLPRGGRPPGA